MSKEYTHIVSSEDKTRKQLSLDLIELDILNVKLYRAFTAAAATLNDKQVQKLQDKGYTVEKNGPVSALTNRP